MIYINGVPANIEYFPDGTSRIRNVTDVSSNEITWQYENDAELFQVFALVNHVKKTCPVENITLYIPYIPNARMDRVKAADEVFTLKYFADIINLLGLKNIKALDVHSNVSLALINNIENIAPKTYVDYCINKIKEENPGKEIAIYFPDEGAGKRYGELFPGYQTCFGIKKRDWRSGQIKGLDVYGIDEENNLKDKVVLMVDDICSFGGTFYYSADKLKELGAAAIYSYTSHTELNLLDEEKGTFIKHLKSGVVKKHFTTNSLYNAESDYVEVVNCL